MDAVPLLAIPIRREPVKPLADRMLGWFRRRTESRGDRAAERAFDRFVSGLAAADNDEIGLIGEQVDHWRDVLAGLGIDPSDPLAAGKNLGEVEFILGRVLTSGQPNARHLAVGLMVWVYTIRAAARPALAPRAKRMWAELRRGPG